MKHLITILVVAAFSLAVAQASEECCKAKAKAETKAKAVKSDGSAKGAQQLVKK